MERLCCSIEMEPKTLTKGGLNNAREAALDIVQEEEGKVLNISTKELGLLSMEVIEKKAEQRGGLGSVAELKESVEIIKRSWDYQCISTASEESLDKSKIM